MYDGQYGGARGVDRIRIRIWVVATSTVVYYTQMGAPDAADPSILAFGSVAILR